LRTEKLTDRKPELKHLMAKVPESRTRYADDIEQYGRALFQPVCEMDLGALWPSIGTRLYTTERTTWFKIKNRSYSQTQGREEFERDRYKDLSLAGIVVS